jgi:hypothetical protein
MVFLHKYLGIYVSIQAKRYAQLRLLLPHLGLDLDICHIPRHHLYQQKGYMKHRE